tara:strand:+ start:4692 stop:4895 length:204 start_codon:yes stop_codon:yes gene_type:complete
MLDIAYWVTMIRLVQMGIPWEVAIDLSKPDLNLVIATLTSMSEVNGNQQTELDLATNYSAMAKQFGG